MSNSMINPPIVELLERVDNRYSLVVVTSKRARQLIDGQKPLINIKSSKPLTIAINEINEEIIEIENMKEDLS
jgi:DNA-directed RNA polymerase subunit omega